MLEYTPLMTQGNCVTAAQQTLTLYVGVRIPIPLPERSTAKAVLFFRSGRGIEDSHHSSRSERGSHFASKAMGARSREPRAKIFAQRANTLVPAPISRKLLQSPRFYGILIIERWWGYGHHGNLRIHFIKNTRRSRKLWVQSKREKRIVLPLFR